MLSDGSDNGSHSSKLVHAGETALGLCYASTFWHSRTEAAVVWPLALVTHCSLLQNDHNHIAGAIPLGRWIAAERPSLLWQWAPARSQSPWSCQVAHCSKHFASVSALLCCLAHTVSDDSTRCGRPVLACSSLASEWHLSGQQKASKAGCVRTLVYFPFLSCFSGFPCATGFPQGVRGGACFGVCGRNFS